jgi:hypothetical protein
MSARARRKLDDRTVGPAKPTLARRGMLQLFPVLIGYVRVSKAGGSQVLD